MLFNETQLDKVIYEILADCREVDPPLDRNEISQHVIDYISEEMHKFVFASLDRLVQKGLVLNDDGATSAPFRFWLPPVDAHN